MRELTILIPSIPERANQLNKLINRLEGQINALPISGEIEYKVLIDNKMQSIGAKRNDLKNIAKGKYFCFLDDDDDIDNDYVAELWGACKNNDVDVISFNSWVSIDGMVGTIISSIENPENEQFTPGIETLRKPSHVNAWKTEKFNQFEFSDKMYGEDFDFCELCYPYVKKEHKINKVLHYYTYDSQITRAF